MLSTHAAFVIPIKLEEHPNADSLSIVKHEGFTLCVRTEDWIGIDKGIHIQPDSLVDTTRPEFAFLNDGKNKKIRVRPKKLRGVFSYGFVIPAPKDSNIGDDYSGQLEVEHYEPPIQMGRQSSNNKRPPKRRDFTKYDIDNIRKYNKVFQDGELVYLSEKVHGANSRFTFASIENEMFIGSRGQWKSEDDNCPWWRAFKKYLEIESFCRDHPDWTLYGEIYGQVQNLKYGKSGIDFVAFDIRRKDMSWCNSQAFRSLCKQYNIPAVPIIAWNMPFNFDEVLEYANGKSLIMGANHCREGCVVKPMEERYDDKIGRVILKCVGQDYLLK